MYYNLLQKIYDSMTKYGIRTLYLPLSRISNLGSIKVYFEMSKLTNRFL